MTPHVAEIWRHPIKSHGREALPHVLLSEGRTLPWDRRWAVAHERSCYDHDRAPRWQPCSEFTRIASSPRLQAISCYCVEADNKIVLSHPDLPDLKIDPDEDGCEFVQWVMAITTRNRALPARLVPAPEQGMTDTDYPSISLINTASHRAVAEALGQDISHLRWRANLVLDGLAPWEERELVGKRVRVGLAELEIRENITRCMATTASTRTGERDADTLGALKRGWDHQEFGVCAVVTKTGNLRQGDPFEVLG